MNAHRPLRVGSTIREELAKILLTELDFQGALATLTEVVVDEHMVWADVLVSVIPTEKSDTVLRKLEHNSGRLQHLLNKKLGIRPMPRIRFKVDHGPEKAARIEKILLEDNNKETLE